MYCLIRKYNVFIYSLSINTEPNNNGSLHLNLLNLSFSFVGYIASCSGIFLSQDSEKPTGQRTKQTSGLILAEFM